MRGIWRFSYKNAVKSNIREFARFALYLQYYILYYRSTTKEKVIKSASTIHGVVARIPRPEAERQADVKLGKRLARIRRERGITQVELATKLNIAQSAISSYERGRLRMHPALIVKLTTLLEVSADDLLGLTRRPIKEPNQRILRRLKAMESLPKRDQDALLRTIDAVLTARKAS